MGANKVRQVTADPDFATLPREIQDQLLIEADAVPEDSSAPAEAAPAPEPTSTGVPAVDYLNKASGPFVKAAAQGAADVVNPMSYVRTIQALYRGATNPSGMLGDIIAGAKNVGEAVQTPEGAGSLAGALTSAYLTSRIPVGGLLGKIGKYGRESKAENVIRAVGEVNPTKKAAIQELVNSGELELPVSRSAKSLQEKFKVKQEAAGTKLDAAKAGLDNLPEASVAKAVDDLKAQRPEIAGRPVTVTAQPRTPAGLTSKTPAPVTKTVAGPPGTGDPQLRNAIDKQIEQIMNVAGESKMMKPADIQKMKEQLNAAADRAGAYEAAVGTTEAAGSEAAKAAAQSMREVLETSPDIPEAVRKSLTAANREMSTILSVTKPLEAQRRAHLGGNVISRSIAGLLGRGLTGGGTSALGAAGGVEVGAQFQNVLFNTLSAAGKAKVAPFLESGDLQGAIQAAFAAHIAENAARRQGAATP